MRAILLCAGRGRRMLPLTARTPKCLLPVEGERSLLALQLRALARCGVSRVCVVVGFGAEQIEASLASGPPPGVDVETVYNPFWDRSDNLVSCWLARHAMRDDFLLLNGDTLFEEALLARVLAGREAPITLTVDRKVAYDADDMKVTLAGDQLRAVGKDLPFDQVDAEAIGLVRVRGLGVPSLRRALDRAIRRPDARGAFYLVALDELARRTAVTTVSIQGLWWREVDTARDLDEVRERFRGRGYAADLSVAAPPAR